METASAVKCGTEDTEHLQPRRGVPQAGLLEPDTRVPTSWCEAYCGSIVV